MSVHTLAAFCAFVVSLLAGPSSRHRKGMSIFRCAVVVVLVSGTVQAATITYVGANFDQVNYGPAGLNIGQTGFWFPQFAASSPVSGRPTNDNQRFAPPGWASFNFTTNAADPTRTFSLDEGGVNSAGGWSTWNLLTLPDGESGLSGSIVDPHTDGSNSNNTINKILLGAGVPNTFYLSIVIDNTNHEHDPQIRLRARGETSGGTQIEANTFPGASTLSFNGVADYYTFRYDGFTANDFIKLQLNGGSVQAGIAGLMFDTINPVPEPGTFALAVMAALGLVAIIRRSI